MKSRSSLFPKADSLEVDREGVDELGRRALRDQASGANEEGMRRKASQCCIKHSTSSRAVAELMKGRSAGGGGPLRRSLFLAVDDEGGSGDG
jgi:hypothetical protein